MAAKNTLLAAVLALAPGAFAAAQEAAPLSAIDWLDTLPPPTEPPGPSEPAATVSASVPGVVVTPLDGPAARRVGLVPADVTGLPDRLWSGADGTALAARIAALPQLRLPALQQLAFTLMLAEATPPAGDTARFDLARIDMLLAYGALDPAMALMAQAGMDTSPAHFARAIDMALIFGNTSTPCAVLRAQPRLSPGPGHDILCAARSNDWSTAALLLGSARVLELLPDAQVTALERFLDPELFENDPDLPLPDAADPLMFRVFAAAGQPIPTRGLPVVYANADLSSTAGWKTQIEAAERLAQAGTLPGNRLLGLYSARQAAASGGVWDRVRAVQRLETALNSRSASAVSKTLPTAWRLMGEQGLQVLFAGLFAEKLRPLVLSGAAADIAFDLLLLSPQYEAAEQVFPARALRAPIYAAIARGAVANTMTGTGREGAALRGFSTADPDQEIVALAQSGALGAAILETLSLAHAGSAGDVTALARALATLRALGLEDVARRTALQSMLLSGAT
ncbi:MAG: hypothetical protein AAF601_07025 [Pseudomonadota bacterium]